MLMPTRPRAWPGWRSTWALRRTRLPVYGDGGNDVMMLERFRHSYAPSNASDAAKEAAGTILGHFATYSVSRHMRRTFRQEHSHFQIA